MACRGDGKTPAKARTAAPDLGPDSSVLVLSTEGATDPVAYAEIVGPQAP